MSLSDDAQKEYDAATEILEADSTDFGAAASDAFGGGAAVVEDTRSAADVVGNVKLDSKAPDASTRKVLKTDVRRLTLEGMVFEQFNSDNVAIHANPTYGREDLTHTVADLMEAANSKSRPFINSLINAGKLEPKFIGTNAKKQLYNSFDLEIAKTEGEKKAEQKNHNKTADVSVTPPEDSKSDTTESTSDTLDTDNIAIGMESLQLNVRDHEKQIFNLEKTVKMLETGMVKMIQHVKKLEANEGLYLKR